MPTYEYRCRECGHAFEEHQSIHAESLTKCPNCGKSTLKRLMGGGGGMIFKGSGFYGTDYKKSRTAESSGSSKTKDTKTDGKPAADSSTPAKNTETKTEKKTSTDSSAPKTDK